MITAIAIVVGLISVLFSGALLSAAADSEKAKLGASFSKAKSRYLSLLGTSIICGLILLVTFIPGTVLIILGAVLGGAGVALIAIGAIVMIVLALYVSLRLWIADAACVVGGYGAFESVRRSWDMMKGKLWRVFAMLLVMGLISGIVGGIVGGILKYTISLASPTAGSFVSAFVTGIFAIPITVAMVLSYMQLAGPAKAQARRTRK